MQAYGDDNDFGASPDGSFDEDQNEQTEEIEEAEGDVDADAEMEAEDEEESENEVEDVFKEEEENSDPAQATQALDAPLGLAASSEGPSVLDGPRLPPPTSHPRPTVFLTSPSPQRAVAPPERPVIQYPSVLPTALRAAVYDIVPTIAAPQGTSINTITATPDLRWVFSGGTDGYIRKFNWVDTVNSKVMLTVAQRHPFVDSVTKAGVLASYWENEEPNPKPGDDGPTLSPVYSLAVHHQGLWLLSGLESGGINLQSVRHDEGKRIICLRGHTSAVSVLNLARDEKSVLSGSWDKTIHDWDLNTGQIKRTFTGSGGQISAIEMRPLSSLPVPETSDEQPLMNGTLFSDSADAPRTNGLGSSRKTDGSTADNFNLENGVSAASPVADSLFGGNDGDSLFGDNDDDNAGAPSGGNFGDDDDDDEFSRAIANGLQQQEDDEAEGDVSLINPGPSTDAASITGLPQPQERPTIPEPSGDPGPVNLNQPPLTNGLPHSDEMDWIGGNGDPIPSVPDITPAPDSTFLAASIDGTIRVWDKRKLTPAAKISPRNVPPWCMGACWSPDGNFMYAGRRNGTVEEFSLHKGLRGAERTFKFPQGSGAVSAVRAMPNGRHLICASFDILRLYDLQQQQTFKHSSVPFLIIPGHRSSLISQLYIDPACRYLISAAGNRGWDGLYSEVLLGYEINV